MNKTMLNHIFHTLLMYGRFSQVYGTACFLRLPSFPLVSPIYCTHLHWGLAARKVQAMLHS